MEFLRPHKPVVAAFLLGMSISLGIAGLFLLIPGVTFGPPIYDDIQIPDGNIPLLQTDGPSRLRIPAIALDVPFAAPLGLNEDGTIEVPSVYDAVGWYMLGSEPGEIGPAAVLGHVDSLEGPAVFFDLARLKEGDMVFITRGDGSVAVFTVDKTETYDQRTFPTTDVYGPVPYAGLRLITCAGEYDRSQFRYSHNLVVYARLATIIEATNVGIIPSTF